MNEKIAQQIEKMKKQTIVSFGTLFDADFVELNETDFCLYLMVCSSYLEVKASLKRLKALTSKYGEHEK